MYRSCCTAKIVHGNVVQIKLYMNLFCRTKDVVLKVLHKKRLHIRYCTGKWCAEKGCTENVVQENGCTGNIVQDQL